MGFDTPYSRYAGRAAVGLAAAAQDYYSRTQTLTQRPRNMPQTWEIAELTRTRRSKTRRYRKTLRNAWKLLNNGRSVISLRYEAMSRWAEPGFGKNRLFWHQNTAGVNTQLPMHWYRLGACVQDVNGVRTFPIQAIGSPILGSTTLTYSTLGVALPVNSLGVDAATYVPYVSYASNAGNDPDFTAGKSAMLISYNIKLLCYGRASLPTKYRIFLCRIKDPDLTVDDLNTSDQLQTSQMLRNMAASYTYNPAFLGAGSHQRGWQNVQVIMSKSFTIGSINSNEGSNTIPHMKEVSFYWRPNINMRFDWDERTVVAGTQPNAVPSQVGQLREIVQPTSQIYLCVMAQSKLSTAAGAATYVAADNPTYDIAWNAKWGIAPS